MKKEFFSWANISFIIMLFLFMLLICISYAGAQVDKVPSQKNDPSISENQEKPSQSAPDLQLLLTANTITTIIYVLAILILKLTVFLIGFKTVVMGHDLLIKGIKGDLDFTFTSNSVISTKLQSASPGTFFVLLGTALIAWGLFVVKPLEIKFSIDPQEKIQIQSTKSKTDGQIKLDPQGHGLEKPDDKKE